jgi:hypothetical protein
MGPLGRMGVRRRGILAHIRNSAFFQNVDCRDVTPILPSLFSNLGKHEIFTPSKTNPPMTMSELAKLYQEDPMEEGNPS